MNVRQFSNRRILDSIAILGLTLWFHSMILLELSECWACFITCCEWNQTCIIYCWKYLLDCSACSSLYWFNRRMWSNETGVQYIEMSSMLRPGLTYFLPLSFPWSSLRTSQESAGLAFGLDPNMPSFSSPFLLSLRPAIQVPEATVLSALRSNPFPDLFILLSPLSEQKLYISILYLCFIAFSTSFETACSLESDSPSSSLWVGLWKLIIKSWLVKGTFKFRL